MTVHKRFEMIDSGIEFRVYDWRNHRYVVTSDGMPTATGSRDEALWWVELLNANWKIS